MLLHLGSPLIDVNEDYAFAERNVAAVTTSAAVEEWEEHSVLSIPRRR